MEDLKAYLSELVDDRAKSGTIRTEELAVLLSRLERAEARVNLLESGIVSELVVTSVHSASAIGTTVSGISEELLKMGYDGLTERLEQAEQAVQRVREVATAMANHSLPESPRGGAWETAHGAQLFAKDILETLGGDGRE